MNEKDHDDFDSLLRHTLKHGRIPQPPANFAHEVARQVDGLPEQANVETWITRLALAIVAAGVAAFTLPQASMPIGKALALLDGTPWPLLLTVAIFFGGMKLFEIKRPSMDPT